MRCGCSFALSCFFKLVAELSSGNSTCALSSPWLALCIGNFKLYVASDAKAFPGYGEVQSQISETGRKLAPFALRLIDRLAGPAGNWSQDADGCTGEPTSAFETARCYGTLQVKTRTRRAAEVSSSKECLPIGVSHLFNSALRIRPHLGSPLLFNFGHFGHHFSTLRSSALLSCSGFSSLHISAQLFSPPIFSQ